MKWISSPLPHLRLPRIAPNNEHKNNAAKWRTNLASPSKLPATFQGQGKNWSGTSVLGAPILAIATCAFAFSLGILSTNRLCSTCPPRTMEPLGGQISSVGTLLQGIFPFLGDQIRFMGIMAKQRSTACIPRMRSYDGCIPSSTCVCTVPWLVLPHGTVASYRSS